MKEAAWALRPTTELEIAEERRQVVFRKRVGWAFALSSVGLCPLSCLNIVDIAQGDRNGILGALPLLLFIAVLLFYTHHNRRASEFTMARLGALREEYADLQGWLVEIAVLQGAVPTGYDRGVLWFEEDRLMFVGERTSFALGAAAVRRGPRDHWGTGRLLPTTTLPIKASGRVGKVALGFTVFADYVPGQVYRGVGGLQAALRGWVGAGGFVEGQGPPLALGPDCPSAGALLRGALGVSLVWGLLGAVVGAFAMAEEYGVMAVVAAIVLVVSMATPDLWTLSLRWRAWRDRRRLEVLP